MTSLRKATYISLYDAQDVNQWSGTPYFQTQALAQHLQIDYENLAHIQPSFYFKIQTYLQKHLARKRTSLRYDITLAKKYADALSIQLKNTSSDFILSPQVQPLSFLDSKRPIVLWTDALFLSLIGFYHPSSSLSKEYVLNANELTRACLERCTLAVFASQWAAEGAIRNYGFAKEKVTVIPLGANLDHAPSYAEVKTAIESRSQHTLRLLFVGKDWYRKGGDIVLAVARALHTKNMSVEVHVVGCYPPDYQTTSLPAYVHCHGFIDKRTEAGRKKLQKLFEQSHFFFMPSRSDCYGVVYAEASAFGVPSIASFVGGIETVIENNINGQTFALNSAVDTYCDYIIDLFTHKGRYHALAFSSFERYQKRLNWQVAIKTLLSKVSEYAR